MDKIETAAAALRAAAAQGVIAALPEGATPADEAEAYAVQDRVLAGAPVAGWKVAPKAPFTGAPIAAARLVADGAALPADMPAPEVEVEVAVMIARDLPPREAPYAEAEVLAACGGLRVAFEIVQSRYIDRKAVPPLAGLADVMANGAFGLGSGFGASAADWTGMELGDLTAVLRHDGAVLAETERAFTTAGAIAQLVWLANHARGRGGLKAGQVLITGARIGPLRLPAAGRMELAIPGVGEASFTI